MRTATGLVFSYERIGHPLSKSIAIDDIPGLGAHLRKRLMMTELELDYSPASLKRLEDKLVELPQIIQIDTLSDEGILQIVREIAAYVGEVLVLHAGGNWKSLGSLWSTQVVFEGGIKITKGGRQRVVPSIALSLGNIGAASFDMISLGKKPKLYKDYLSGKNKMVKEHLTNSR